MKITKWLCEPGCDLATGWDGAYLDGKHSTGYEMHVLVSRSMRDPRHVRFSSSIDGSEHIFGSVDHEVYRDGLDAELPAIWDKCVKAESQHRKPIPLAL